MERFSKVIDPKIHAIVQTEKQDDQEDNAAISQRIEQLKKSSKLSQSKKPKIRQRRSRLQNVAMNPESRRLTLSVAHNKIEYNSCRRTGP